MKETSNKKSELLSWIKCIAAAVCIALILRFFVFEFVIVQGDSMEPGLHTGEILFVEKVSKNFDLPDYGDVVVVKYTDVDDRYYVKRVIGRPGDVLAVQDGVLLRNGEKITEDYLLDDYIAQEMPDTIVPEEHIFVMGDNRNDSMDSRSSRVGAIPREDIVGVGKLILLPLENFKALP